jgi:Ribonucleotide reductase inhibitor
MVSTIKRRRFQAPITSFFTSQLSSPEALLNAQQAQQQQEPLLSPALPDEIQSSLLTVGMRIRKSVPEGYKTQKSPHLGLIYDQSKYVVGSGGHDYDSTTNTSASSISRGGYAELAPFCGLHKIGGMAVQPMPAVPSDFDPTGRNAEHVETLNPWSVPSSQESTYSDAPLPASNKRNFAFDREEEDDDDVDDEVGNDLSQQPSSYPFSHTDMPSLNTFFPAPGRSEQRAFAIPRSRFPGSRDRRLVLEGQENLGLTSKSSGTLKSNHESDFEDADFLEAREDVDMDNVRRGC